MLKILYNLKPFFEDNYRRIHVREYAKLQNISPPTSSKILEELTKMQFLRKEVEKQYNYYYANKKSEMFKDLQRIYYKEILKELTNYLKYETINSIIILFGSLSKSEANTNSDIDIAIITPIKKELKVEQFEKKLNRNIQLFMFKSIEDIPEELRNNILNGYKLYGDW